MKKWDYIEQQYIFDHGLQIDYDNNEMLLIKKNQFEKLSYTGKSIKDNSTKTIMIPSVFGACLIFENKHFKIVE